MIKQEVQEEIFSGNLKMNLLADIGKPKTQFEQKFSYILRVEQK